MDADRRRFERALRTRHPGFIEAVLADATVTSRNRGRPLAGKGRGRILAEAARLAWQSDGFLAQVLYRGKARLQALGVPILPRLLHRLAIATSGLYIGDPVLVHPGVHLAHGQIVIDGIVEVGHGTVVFPFTTIGLIAGKVAGPRIGEGVSIGSGSRVLGDIAIGDRATIGANSVVIDDVAAGATVVGAPARVVGGA
jgi:serine O-acetyltransferase